MLLEPQGSIDNALINLPVLRGGVSSQGGCVGVGAGGVHLALSVMIVMNMYE